MRKIYIIIFVSLMFVPSVFGQGSSSADSQGSSGAQKSNDNTDILNEEGVESAQRGEYENAIRQFNKAISIQDAKAAVSYNNLAYTYMLSGDRDTAILFYKKALERNPNMLPAMGNLGKLLYETEKFEESIIYGEKLLQRDPYNVEVRQWLPDAYRLAAKQRMDQLQNPAEESEGDTGAPATRPAPAKRPMSEIGYAAGGQFRYNKIPISLLKKKYKNIKVSMYGPPSTSYIPMDIFGNFWMSPEVQVRFDIKSPYSVMEFPSFISTEEKMEFMFYGKKAFFGAGILFSQSNFREDNISKTKEFITNFEYPIRDDVKLGFTVGSRSEYNYFVLSAYPRYLFTDPKKGPLSIEYDLSKFYMEYRRTVPADEKRQILPGHLEMALIIDIKEAFVLEYLVPPKNKINGHFFGIYDFTIDITFGKIQPMFKKVPTVFGLSITERIYLFELNEKSPRTYGNGFGFFGFDWLKATSGNPFASFHTNSMILRLYLKQMFASRIVLKEEIGYEISGDSGDYNAFSLDLAVGFSF